MKPSRYGVEDNQSITYEGLSKKFVECLFKIKNPLRYINENLDIF